VMIEIKLDPELQKVVDAAKAANPNPPHAADVPLAALRAGYVMISRLQSLLLTFRYRVRWHQLARGLMCQKVQATRFYLA